MPEEVLTAPQTDSSPSAVPPPGGTEGATTTTAQGAPPQQSDNIRQLREAYEGVKRDFEPWQKLGIKPEQVTQYSTIYQKVYSEAATIGRELGYPDHEIEEALAEDPVRTIDFLRNQHAELQGQQAPQQDVDLNQLVQERVQEVMGPIQQRENTRMTNEANALFERTVHQLATETFKKEGIDIANVSEDERFMLTSAVSEILKYDDNALRDLKYNGKTGAVQKAFQEAMTYLDKYYLARQARGQAKIAPARQGMPAQQSGNKPPSLDEIGNDPEAIDRFLGRTGDNAKYRHNAG